MYDAAGNMTKDPNGTSPQHTYTYDADGNLTGVDGGSTATYTYDALNHRTEIAPTRGTYDFVFDIFGRKVSTWSASGHFAVIENIYSDSGPIAFRNGLTNFEHLNWIGTERLRTSYTGSTETSFTSLPWGDDLMPNGDNGDQYDFASLDRDLEDNTEHAQFRNYSVNQGRWLTPDPYYGSYDATNPQSFNRYNYALNDPVSLIDPSGLHLPVGEGGGGYGSDCANNSVCIAEGGSNGDSGFWGDPWGGPPTSALGALAQQQEIWWALFTPGVGGSPLYGYGFGGLYQYSWLFTPNPDYVYTDTPNLDDGDPTASDGTFSPYLAFVGPISSGAVIAGPGNGSSFAPNKAPGQPANPQSPIAKYGSFLLCELNNDIEQITDEEDAQNPKQIPLVVSAAAVVGAVKGVLPGWTGLTGAVTGGLYVINIAGRSNMACTDSVYGH